MEEDKGKAVAILGGGCFWCLEAAFELLPGVLQVENGYSGGKRQDPTYDEVCSGNSGHAEVVRINFDPARVTYTAILDLFWKVHDPTTTDRQGADIGSQYRSVIFYLDEAQRASALASMAAIAPSWPDPLVTDLLPAPRFWKAEEWHQSYFRKHPEAGYCRAVIVPKLRKVGFRTAP